MTRALTLLEESALVYIRSGAENPLEKDAFARSGPACPP
jgi:hypothetical protein